MSELPFWSSAMRPCACKSNPHMQGPSPAELSAQRLALLYSICSRLRLFEIGCSRNSLIMHASVLLPHAIAQELALLPIVSQV